MEWLRLPTAFFIVWIGSFGAFFLSSAWERRRSRSISVEILLDLLPGHDCGLCGFSNCRSYARSLEKAESDPALCLPGGAGVEIALRTSLGGTREKAMRAQLRCGGSNTNAKMLFKYVGAKDCHVAASLFAGFKKCCDACLGLGSCAKACPLNAISMIDGLARVDTDKCSGCGLCIASCPKRLLVLAPIDAVWYVACSANDKPESRLADCSVACNACGECVRLSPGWEFTMDRGRAIASMTTQEGKTGGGSFATISSRCPSGAIIRSGREKKR